MTTQGLIYSEEVIYETEEVVYPTLPDQRYSFDSIPNEIIEHNIFGYFWFHYWTQHFVSVCKRWKKICENSKITPKHLRIAPKQRATVNIGKTLLWVKKYQPTILELNFTANNSFCNFAIERFVRVSECIDTLILSNSHILEFISPSQALARISTLVLNERFSNEIFNIFPALQRLQIYIQDKDISMKGKMPLKELTVIDPKNVDVYLKHVDVPKLTLVTDSKVIKRIDGKTTELHMPDMTYEEYFRYFGKTKLFVMLSRLNTIAAAKMLETSTSYEYEADLIENNFLSYKYPTNINITNYDVLSNTAHYKRHPDLLSKLPISDNIKFERFVNAGDVDNAIAILAKRGSDIDEKSYDVRLPSNVPGLLEPHMLANIMPDHDRPRIEDFVANYENFTEIEFGDNILTDYESVTGRSNVRQAFFKLLSHPQVDARIFNHEKVREAAKAIISSEIKHGCKLLRSFQQFETIADIVDWSAVFAKVDDCDLFWAMIKKGAKMPYRAFKDQALSPKAAQFSKILQEVTTQNPSVWYDILALSSPGHALKIMERYGVSPLIEKDGKALWHAWFNNTMLKNTQYINIDTGVVLPMYPEVYTNHMDSTGSTILLMMIEDLDERNAERYLKEVKGIDTNQHQHGKLSPLATLLVKSAVKQPSSQLILMLANSGADINLACTFEGRQCSPLMIAVLVGSPLPTISLLIALGARTDYCDDQGRSVVDCVVECENKYEASDYRTLKWILS